MTYSVDDLIQLAAQSVDRIKELELSAAEAIMVIGLMQSMMQTAIEEQRRKAKKE